MSFPCGSAGKESAWNVGDPGSIHGSGRSTGEGKGYLLQYSGLENSMNCIVLGVTKSGTRLSYFHIVFVLKYSLKVVFESFWYQFSSVQSFSRVQFSVTPWTSAHQASLSITNSRSPPKPMSSELMMPSNYLILCRPLLLLPSIFPSIRVFSNESALCTRRPKYWSFSFNISPSNEHPGLSSFRMDWLDLLTVQGTLKSLLRHHSSKASILWCSVFFIVQLSHPYMTTGKTIALTRWTFVDKGTSLL